VPAAARVELAEVGQQAVVGRVEVDRGVGDPIAKIVNVLSHTRVRIIYL
jgi:hypothetical protein